MRCEEARELLPGYADQELSPAEQQRLQAHLDACADCSREAEGYAKLAAVLRSQPMETPPRNIVSEVIGKVKTARALSIRRMMVRVAAVAASLLVAASVGYHAWVRTRPVHAPGSPVADSSAAANLNGALTDLWGMFSDTWVSMPNYSQDLITGVEWLAAPVSSYVHDALTPQPEDSSQASLG